MRIITYRDLRPGRFTKPLERLRAGLGRDDFAAAGLKKLAPTPYWRAKLSDEGGEYGVEFCFRTKLPPNPG
jgi:hypothetical protein